MPTEKWESFSNEWAQTLADGKRIDYLHMKETGKHELPNGQFAGWSRDDIEKKLLTLAQVISKYEPLGLSAHTEWSIHKEFESKSSLAKYIQNPYKLLFHEITRLMYGIAKNWNNLEPVDFFFDEHGEMGIEAASWYRDMKEAFPQDARSYFGSTPEFKDDKKLLPLQAADMFAWFHRRRLWKPVSRPRMVQIECLITQGFAAGSEADFQGYENAARSFEKVEKMRTTKNLP